MAPTGIVTTTGIVASAEATPPAASAPSRVAVEPGDVGALGADLQGPLPEQRLVEGGRCHYVLGLGKLYVGVSGGREPEVRHKRPSGDGTYPLGWPVHLSQMIVMRLMVPQA